MRSARLESAKQRLVANGTYNADGTLNMETAERIGLAQRWRGAEEQSMARAETQRIKEANSHPK